MCVCDRLRCRTGRIRLLKEERGERKREGMKEGAGLRRSTALLSSQWVWEAAVSVGSVENDVQRV